MKPFFQFCRFFVLLPVVLLVHGCDQKEVLYEYKVKVPVLEKMASIRQMDVSVVSPKPLATSGKIYLYKDYLFINEPNEGIHILDNKNPSNPISMSFLEIPGNVDLAVNSGILYADSYVDLLTFDLNNPTQPNLLERLEDVFESQYVYQYLSGGNEKMVVVDYKDTVINSTSSNVYFPFSTSDKIYYSNVSESIGNQNYGVGGSMARFTLANEHLYTVNNTSLHLFDVGNPRKPIFVKDIPLGWGIETIFPYKDNLFIGSTTGMHIYNISQPGEPSRLSVYTHFTACDPVVVNDDYAFVTLRSGNICGLTNDVLEVIDIKDLTEPKLLKTFTMQNPHGLGLSGDVLYICEGDYGFKSFNVSDISTIDKNLLEHLKDMKSTDVIPGPKSLIVVGKDGVCQYDYSNKGKISLLSCISKAVM
ncbi:hypothetical protein FAZ15_11425 [Sphingobacterium olei]|uniref:LVIVD repeat-containing protein n=1 Tax=Sphingobacterium olei TaxID=2571155 RepID=A0A4V5MMD9_9SPHI|nr:hypothetical protein [Sphingobacterium olei]TJZ60598.1 hypothetical protein FAZ15_11425 [Sphingobacterium olei]